jgi:hypothetical protein
MRALKVMARRVISGDFWPVFDLELAPSGGCLIRAKIP